MLFIQKLATDPNTYIIWILLVMFSVCFHEFTHAYVALLQGDSTAAERGYLTLNPFKQMGGFSIIALLLIGITWGAVPVNPSRMRKRYSHALVALSGPLTNLLLFVVFSLLTAFVTIYGGYDLSNSLWAKAFFIGGVLNVVLFLFNILPVPPLDGWTIFSYLFPSISELNSELKNGIIFGLFVLIFFSFNKLFLIGAYSVITVVQFSAYVIPV